MVMAKFDPGHP